MSDNTKAMRLNYKADEINTAINKALKSIVVSFSADDSDRQPGQIYLDKDNRDPDLAYNQYMFREEQPSTSQEIAIWSGTTKEPLFGNGSEENPYEISCGEHLAYILKNEAYLGKYYKLTADIYLNDTTKINWQNGALLEIDYKINEWYDEWRPEEALGFYGHFDGNYHTIYGLYLKVANTEGKPPYVQSATAGGALFPDLEPGTTTIIKNLGVDYCYIDQPFNASAFVASQSSNTSLTIDKCWVGADVSLKSARAGAFVGSQNQVAAFNLTNSFSLGTAQECYSYVDEAVGQIFNKGGLIGYGWGLTPQCNKIKNCYCATGPITNHPQFWNADTKNSYYTYYVNTFAVSENPPFEHEGIKYYTVEQMKGLDVLINSSKMLGLNSDNAYIAMAEDYPRIINSIGMVKISDSVTKTYVDKVINEQLNAKKVKRGYTVEIDDISSVPHYIKCSISYQDYGKTLILEALPENHSIKHNLIVEKATQASLTHLEYGKYYYISVKYVDGFNDTQNQNIYIDKSTYDGSGSPFIYQNNNQTTTKPPLGQEFQADTLFILNANPEDIKSISIIPLEQASDTQFDFDNISIMLTSENGIAYYPADTNGVVHAVRSVYPSLSITANAPVVITCEYIKDTPFADIIGMIVPRYLAENII